MKMFKFVTIFTKIGQYSESTLLQLPIRSIVVQSSKFQRLLLIDAVDDNINDIQKEVKTRRKRRRGGRGSLNYRHCACGTNIGRDRLGMKRD